MQIAAIQNNPYHLSSVVNFNRMATATFMLQALAQSAEAVSLGSIVGTVFNGVGNVVKATVETTATVTVNWVIVPIAKATGLDKAIEAVVHEFFVKPGYAVTGLLMYYVNKNFLVPACQSASIEYVLQCKEGLWKRKDAICWNSWSSMALACGISKGAYLIEAESFLQAMPAPIVQRSLELAQQAIAFFGEHKLIQAGATVSFAHFILHPLCIDAKEDHNKNCNSIFDDLGCAASGTKLTLACGAELAAYIGAGKLFCDAMFPGLCILATYV